MLLDDMTTATPSTPQPEDTHPRRGPVQVIFIALGIALGLFVIYRVQAVILALIMAIFFAKYVHAVMRAFDAPVLSTTPFVVALSAVYGLLSGYFVAKALNLLRLAREA